jgi:hypothetical protein
MNNFILRDITACSPLKVDAFNELQGVAYKKIQPIMVYVTFQSMFPLRYYEEPTATQFQINVLTD